MFAFELNILYCFLSGEVIGEICKAYKKELEVKRIVKENIAHSSTKQELKYYIITWVHQPYIDTQTDFLLESLLQETGLRWIKQIKNIILLLFLIP